MDKESIKQYGISQASALTALVVWYPAMARCVFTEANFVEPNFTNKYFEYFSKPINSYRGIDVYFMGQFFYPLLDLSTTKFSKLFSQITTGKRDSEPEFEHKLCGGIMTGALSPIIYNPMKAMVVTAQEKKLSNLWTSTKYFYQNYGLTAFYRGSMFYMIRNATFAPCLLVLPMYFENMLNTCKPLQDFMLSKPISYMLSAMIAVTVTMPSDVFSTLSLKDPMRTKYKTNWDIIKESYTSKKGIFGFFSGFKWRLLATVLEFSIYNTAKNYYTELSKNWRVNLK